MTAWPPALARCTERGYTWRWRTAADRPCPLHSDDGSADLADRAAALGVVMTAPPNHELDDADHR